ncbi:MAG: hypothetical protein U0324_42890 [Polyangiales bacterium]
MSPRPLHALALASLLSACGAPQTPAPAAPAVDLAGRWASACVPNGSGQHIQLRFAMTARDWSLDYVTYADAACATPFVTAHIEGPYEVTGPSAVAGAHEGTFRFTRKTLRAHGAAAAGFLSSAQGCGRPVAPDADVDISAEGCAGLGQRPVSACGQDYDLVSVEGDSLRFGQRPADNDLCTPAHRPAALSPLAMQRQR